MQSTVLCWHSTFLIEYKQLQLKCALFFDPSVPDSQQSEDMDISPGSTPTEESMMERISFSALSPCSATTPTSTQGAMSAAAAGAIASLPQLIQQLSDKNQVKVDSQQLTQQGKSPSCSHLQWKIFFFFFL